MCQEFIPTTVVRIHGPLPGDKKKQGRIFLSSTYYVKEKRMLVSMRAKLARPKPLLAPAPPAMGKGSRSNKTKQDEASPINLAPSRTGGGAPRQPAHLAAAAAAACTRRREESGYGYGTMGVARFRSSINWLSILGWPRHMLPCPPAHPHLPRPPLQQ